MKKAFNVIFLVLSFCSLIGQGKILFIPGGIIQESTVLEASIREYKRETLPTSIKDSLALSYLQLSASKRKLYRFSLEYEPLPVKRSFEIEPENFYVVRIKNETIFDYDSRLEDTLLLKKFQAYFPFDEKYLIYYDSTKKRWPLLLSGPAKLGYFRYDPNEETTRYINPSSAGLFRMFSYGIDHREPLTPFRTKSHPPRAEGAFVWYNLDSCTLSFNHPAILKVPHSRLPYEHNGYDKMEVVFYTDTIPTLPKPEPVVDVQPDTVLLDPNSEYPASLPPPGIEEKDLYEVKYIIHNNPQSHKETLIPHFRKISEVEKRDLLDFLADERIGISHFFIDSKTLYEKMSPYHLLPQK